MLEELKEDAIANKVGGKFKLATLIQKRMIALNQGARPLVDLRTNNKMEIVIQEILQDKIYLDLSERVSTVTEDPEPLHHETIDLTSPVPPAVDLSAEPAAVTMEAEPAEISNAVAVADMDTDTGEPETNPTSSPAEPIATPAPSPARKEKSSGRSKAAAQTKPAPAAQTKPVPETAEGESVEAKTDDAESRAASTEPSA